MDGIPCTTCNCVIHPDYYEEHTKTCKSFTEDSKMAKVTGCSHCSRTAIEQTDTDLRLCRRCFDLYLLQTKYVKQIHVEISTAAVTCQLCRHTVDFTIAKSVILCSECQNISNEIREDIIKSKETNMETTCKFCDQPSSKITLRSQPMCNRCKILYTLGNSFLAIYVNKKLDNCKACTEPINILNIPHITLCNTCFDLYHPIRIWAMEERATEHKYCEHCEASFPISYFPTHACVKNIDKETAYTLPNITASCGKCRNYGPVIPCYRSCNDLFCIRCIGVHICVKEEDKGVEMEVPSDHHSVKDCNFTAVVDGGKERTEFDTGAVREIDEDKGRFDLIPSYPMERLAKHYAAGAKKYADRNWEKGLPLHTFLDSGLRHFFQLLDGEPSEDHAAAVMWNIAGFLWTAEEICKCKLPISLADGLSDKVKIANGLHPVKQ